MVVWNVCNLAVGSAGAKNSKGEIAGEIAGVDFFVWASGIKDGLACSVRL
jgi:hypothetical protein